MKWFLRAFPSNIILVYKYQISNMMKYVCKNINRKKFIKVQAYKYMLLFLCICIFAENFIARRQEIKAEKFSINRNNNEISIAWKLQCNLFWRYFTNSLFFSHTHIKTYTYLCLCIELEKTNNVLVWLKFMAAL